MINLLYNRQILNQDFVLSLFKNHSESIRNDTGSVVRLVGELSYLDCLQYCCVLNLDWLSPISLECDNWRLFRNKD